VVGEVSGGQADHVGCHHLPRRTRHRPAGPLHPNNSKKQKPPILFLHAARCPSPCKNPGFALRSGEVRILTGYLVGELAATTGLGSAYAGNSDADVDLIFKER
jgi:hypothetical protein